jgi:hypothetical protein
MSDDFTEIPNQSIFERLGNAIKGVLFGIILVPVAVVLLFWNEGRAVQTAKSLKEGASIVVSVSPDKIDPANEKKLVHFTGKAETGDTVRDPKFEISLAAIRLDREVKMYQWKEDKKTSTQKKLGGGTESTTTYSYSKTWEKQLKPSVEFRHPEGHENPKAMVATSNSVHADKVMIGAFRLPNSIISSLKGEEPLNLKDEDFQKIPPAVRGKAILSDGALYYGVNPTAPEVGDQRVTFNVLRPATFSVISQQVVDTLSPYHTKANREIERVESGVVSAEEMFAHAKSENNLWTWVLRGIGVLVMTIGFGMILGPFTTLLDVIPFLGGIVGAGIGFVGFVLAGVVSLVVIAVAWFVVRPVLSIALIAAAVGTLIFGGRFAAKRKQATLARQVTAA